ncbi:MAG: flagellar hook-associated family protein [Methylocystis sp.]|nr:flagellar hook-associated family protein [Methylocystis sp.]
MIDIISTPSLTSVLRRSVLEMQTQLSQAQIEVSTGRVADIGLSLGVGAGRDYALGVREADLQSITQTNGVVAAQLDATQAALSDILKSAQGFLATLTTAQAGGSDATTIQAQAAASLQSLISDLNTTENGNYIFGGVNTGSAPIADYFATPPAANKQAVDAAFLSAFGVSQSSAGVSSITASQMQTFLSGSFSTLFSPANWSSNWSSASSQTTQSRISLTQTINTSVSANDPALQKLAMAYTMVADLGAKDLSSSAYQTIVQAATQSIGQALSGLTHVQASVGIMQQSVTNANKTMSTQQNAIAAQIGSLENVDPYLASTRINNLLTQIETSYALTAKIQQLSLSKYI